MMIVEIALFLWAFVSLADAFDQCDVRHKFVPETGKSYLLQPSKLKCCFSFKIQKEINQYICHILIFRVSKPTR